MGGLRALPRAVSRLALHGAVGTALLIGAAQHSAIAREIASRDSVVNNRIETELRRGDPAKAVTLGEAAVAIAPRDASLRAELGRAYLRAGRFESAVAALSDAVAMGDTSDGITLSLALAQTACGQNRAALATLDVGSTIAPADLGLALALAGDPGRGIAVLNDAVRDGSGSSVLRQNLAYAYALDGRWADATLTAGFDLPPDQVNARLQQWAQSMQSGGERMRIAQLLNVPLIADLGMPAALAVNETRPDAAPAPVMALASAPPAAQSSLPSVVAVAPPTTTVADQVASPIAIKVSAPPLPPVTTVAVPTSFHRPTVRAHRARLAANHFVQLAAYHSRHSAELGKLVLMKRHALLRGHGLMITQAKLHGRSYWRVVMAGFNGASAANFCSSLKRHGGACFAYSLRPRALGQALAIR